MKMPSCLFVALNSGSITTMCPNIWPVGPSSPFFEYFSGYFFLTFFNSKPYSLLRQYVLISGQFTPCLWSLCWSMPERHHRPFRAAFPLILIYWGSPKCKASKPPLTNVQNIKFPPLYCFKIEKKKVCACITPNWYVEEIQLPPLFSAEEFEEQSLCWKPFPSFHTYHSLWISIYWTYQLFHNILLFWNSQVSNIEIWNLTPH